MQKARSPAPVTTIERTERVAGGPGPCLGERVVDLLAERVHALLAVDRDDQDGAVLFYSEALTHREIQLVLDSALGPEAKAAECQVSRPRRPLIRPDRCSGPRRSVR